MMKFSHRFFYSSLLPAYFQKVKTQSRRKIWDEGWRYDKWKRSAIYLISFCLISSRVVAFYRSRGKRQNTRPRCFNQKFVERSGKGERWIFFSPGRSRWLHQGRIIPSTLRFSSHREIFPRIFFHELLSAYFASSLRRNTSENPPSPRIISLRKALLVYMYIVYRYIFIFVYWRRWARLCTRAQKEK